jgi:hypothetical protein
VLVGIGLDASRLQSFKAQLSDDVNHGYRLIERVEANIPVLRGGEVLGYELLGFESTKCHSWLCHNTPADAYQLFGIRSNGAGFIDSFNAAVRVTENLKAYRSRTSNLGALDGCPRARGQELTTMQAD